MLSWLKIHIRTVVLVAAGISLVPAYLRAYMITGPSDIPSALVGDKLIVNRAAYSLKLPYSNVQLFRIGVPQRGDLVLLHLRDHPRLKVGFFKRIIGLPGEAMEIQENRVFVDGRPLPVETLNPANFAWVPNSHPIGSTVANEDGHWITFTPGRSEHRNFPPLRLSSNQYFVLGDNRDNSEDSRAFGPVPADLLLGEVIVIFPTGERTR